jgi:hypothetical protein
VWRQKLKTDCLRTNNRLRGWWNFLDALHQLQEDEDDADEEVDGEGEGRGLEEEEWRSAGEEKVGGGVGGEEESGESHHFQDVSWFSSLSRLARASSSDKVIETHDVSDT